MKKWDKFHENRVEQLKLEKPHSAVVSLVKSLNSEDRILDHGCGTGRNLFFLLEKGFDVYGVDNSDFAVHTLTEKGFQKYTKGDISKLPYASNFFDALISINVIAHGNMKQVDKYMEEIRRVLKKGGIILIVCPSINFFKHVKKETTKEIEKGTFINIDTPDGDLPHHFFSLDEMEDYFKDSEIIKNEYVEEYNTFMGKKVNHIQFICKNGVSL